MSSAIQITYLHHSGFAIRTSDSLLIFDNARGTPEEADSLGNGHVTPSMIGSHPNTIFFVSHVHADHFNPAIYDMAAYGNVSYVVGEGVPAGPGVHVMHPGDSLTIHDVTVQAFDSTDEGVSFLVQLDGWSIFHAGDLNLWHWRSESSIKEIEQAEKDFLAAVTPLARQPIDFAFFPLDPRMGAMHDAGILYFLMHIKPQVLVPMHWWDRSDVAMEFARRNRTKHIEVLAMTNPGDTIRANKDEAGRIVLIP